MEVNMKKKILTLIAALTCVSAGAMGLVACGGGDGGGNVGDSKTVTGLIIVDGAGVEYDRYDLGTVSFGQSPDFGELQLYLKYSDGTKVLVDSDSNVTETYYYDGNGIPSLPDSHNVGDYCINYTYSVGNGLTYSVTLDFKVATSAVASPYKLNVSAISWKYPEEPTVTLKYGSTEIEKSRYSVYVITKEKYDVIKNAADFNDKVMKESELYMSQSIKPGSYYMFAHQSDYNSDFVSVTIGKGDVTPTTTEGFGSYYSYILEKDIGKIKLSKVAINNNDVAWKDSKGNDVLGGMQWLDPDEEVDSSNSGERRKIKWVPFEHEADFYNEYIMPDPIAVTIEKAYVSVPSLDGYQYDMWDGEEHEIKLLYSDNLDDFNALIKVTHKGEKITVADNRLLGKVSEIGEYTYNFELVDKVNYYWYSGSGDMDDDSDTADKSGTYEIRALDSYIRLAEYGVDYNIDENLQVRIQIKPGLENDGCNASPYKAGTLEAEFLTEYTYDPENVDGSTETSRITATAKVENKEGYDWVVITVTDFKELFSSGLTLIKLTAEGDDYYADIDRVAQIHIEKYNGTITCPITAGETIEKPVGTKVAELYETYPELETKLGKWVMYIKYTPNSDWSEVTDMELSLPTGEYSFKAVYVSDFVEYADEIEAVEFTVKGV